MKYIAVWCGYSSGSPNGRDDGYPEIKIKEIKNLGDVRNTRNIGGVRYYKTEAANIDEMLRDVLPDPLGILKMDQ